MVLSDSPRRSPCEIEPVREFNPGHIDFLRGIQRRRSRELWTAAVRSDFPQLIRSIRRLKIFDWRIIPALCLSVAMIPIILFTSVLLPRILYDNRIHDLFTGRAPWTCYIPMPGCISMIQAARILKPKLRKECPDFHLSRIEAHPYGWIFYDTPSVSPIASSMVQNPAAFVVGRRNQAVGRLHGKRSNLWRLWWDMSRLPWSLRGGRYMYCVVIDAMSDELQAVHWTLSVALGVPYRIYEMVFEPLIPGPIFRSMNRRTIEWVVKRLREQEIPARVAVVPRKKIQNLLLFRIAHFEHSLAVALEEVVLRNVPIGPFAYYNDL